MKLALLAAGAVASSAQKLQWQAPSEADYARWTKDVMPAADTMDDIKNAVCQPPKGNVKTLLAKLGRPTDVMTRYTKTTQKQDKGSTKPATIASYQYKFSNGAIVGATNSNAGMAGGEWRITCYYDGPVGQVATKAPEDQFAMSSSVMSRAKESFDHIDTDDSGTITTGGAYAALSKMFPPNSLPNMEALLEKESIKAAGTDKVVDLDEFMCVATKLYNVQKVYAEFHKYDHDGNLQMNRKELEGALMDFYSKDVMKPGLIQSAAMKAKVKQLADTIIQQNDKNKDDSVSFQEFETDAFKEEHYNPGKECKSSTSPLNKHDETVLYGLMKKFIPAGAQKPILSGSLWYQLVSQLFENEIDMANGSAPAPPLGCMQVRRPQQGSGRKFGQNGGWNKNPQQVNGPRLLQTAIRPATGGDSKGKGSDRFGPRPTKMDIGAALKALRQNADDNHDGEISLSEAFDVFQDVHDSLSASDWGRFLDLTQKVKGPVDCGSFKSCGACTVATNAGLCGWVAAGDDSGNPFGGLLGGRLLRGMQPTSKSSGLCQFVDRTKSADKDDGKDGRPETCSYKCPISGRPTWGNGGGKGPQIMDGNMGKGQLLGGR